MDNNLTTSRLFTPRPYQQECLDVIAAQPPGAYLVQMATGLGKTAVFTHIPHDGRMLILSHREELARQPLQWFSCSTGTDAATIAVQRYTV